MANIASKKVRKIIFDKYDGKCAYCGVDLKDRFSIDHITPKRRHDKNHPNKGKDTMENYNPSCHSCNSSKNTFDVEGWRNHLELRYDRLIRDSATFRSLLRFDIVTKIRNRVTFYFEEYE